MTDRPWETEPNSLEFEAEGLPCVMWRNFHGVWCGYVGVGPEHPLFGLPTNHPLKLPSSWFERRSSKDGYGPMDIFIHALSGGKSLEEACQINLAFEVHGGVSYDGDHVPDHEPDGRWWFGFDCGHAGDYMPGMPSMSKIMGEMIDSMPERLRNTMRGILAKQNAVYRDQQYVVSECQSLAAQLNAVVKVIEKEDADVSSHDRRD